MGMTLTIAVNPKHNGIRYHDLDGEVQQELDEKLPKTEEIFYHERDFRLLTFLDEHAHTLLDNEENGQVYLFIDQDNIDTILERIREKIDDFWRSSDRYNSETYGNGSDLYLWSDLHTSIVKFKESHNLDECYLFIDAAW